MRAKEFISEDRQKLDEALPFILGGLALAGGAAQAYDTYKDIEAYRKGEITGAELAKRGISDAAIAAFGGAVGKGLQKGWQFSKAGIDLLKQGVKGKQAAQAAGKIPAKPGSTVQTPKGPRVAGVDGKPTTIDPTKRGAKSDIKKIKQAAKKQPAGSAGAGTAAIAKGGKNAGKGGAGAATVGSKLKKAIPGKAVATGMGIGALANQVATWDKADQIKGAFSDYFKAASKYQAPEPEKTGKLVYTSPTPGPTQKFDPGGLGLKGEKKPNTKGTK